MRRSSRLSFAVADEQKNVRALTAMIQVALTGGRLYGCRRLRLPVEESRRDGVVAVHRRRRVVVCGLLQGYEEQTALSARIEIDALAQPVSPLECHSSECGENLVERRARMDGKRDSVLPHHVAIQRLRDVFGPLFENIE